MIEWIRRRLMKRLHVKYHSMNNYKGDICPNAQDELEIRKIESRNCFVTLAGNNKYEVDYYDTQCTVDLDQKNCSCRVWDLIGFLCKHAISCIFNNRDKLEKYVHFYFSKDT